MLGESNGAKTSFALSSLTRLLRPLPSTRISTFAQI